MNILNFPDTWLDPLGRGFCEDFLAEMELKLLKYKTEKLNIFPPDPLIFRAMDLVNFKDIKVKYSPFMIIIKTPIKHDKKPINLKKLIFSLKKR